MTSEDYTVGTHSTVRKRAKGMPDTTVETTSLYFEDLNIFLARSSKIERLLDLLK